MQFSNFEEVRGRDEQYLRRLLRSGDGPERVWAAWSLGLRLGQDAVASLGERAEPDPGVRAHLVVVLAGFGQQVALRTLASDDPDPSVRATSCEYLVRIAAPSRRDDVHQFLTAWMASEPSVVAVGRVLRQLPTDWPYLGDDVLAAVFCRESDELSHLVIDYLLRTRTQEEMPLLLLSKRLREERDPHLLVRLAQLLGPGAQADVVAAATRVPDAAPALLQVLVDSQRLLPWDALGELPHFSDPRVQLCCLKLSSSWQDSAALGWLASMVTAGRYRLPVGAFAGSEVERARSDAHSDAGRRARDQVVVLISDPRFALHPPLAPALNQLLQEVDRDLDWLTTSDPEYLEDEGIELETELHALAERRKVLTTALEQCP